MQTTHHYMSNAEQRPDLRVHKLRIKNTSKTCKTNKSNRSNHSRAVCYNNDCLYVDSIFTDLTFSPKLCKISPCVFIQRELRRLSRPEFKEKNAGSKLLTMKKTACLPLFPFNVPLCERRTPIPRRLEARLVFLKHRRNRKPGGLFSVSPIGLFSSLIASVRPLAHTQLTHAYGKARLR